MFEISTECLSDINDLKNYTPIIPLCFETNARLDNQLVI